MAFKMRGNPMKRNFGIGSPVKKGHIDPKKVKQDAKESHDASVLDSDALMRAKQDVTKKEKETKTAARNARRAMDYASRGANPDSEEMKRFKMENANKKADVALAAEAKAKKKVSQAFYPSGKAKKGSGKLGPYEY